MMTKRRFSVFTLFFFGITPRTRPEVEAGFTGNRKSLLFQRVQASTAEGTLKTSLFQLYVSIYKLSRLHESPVV